MYGCQGCPFFHGTFILSQSTNLLWLHYWTFSYSLPAQRPFFALCFGAAFVPDDSLCPGPDLDRHKLVEHWKPSQTFAHLSNSSRVISAACALDSEKFFVGEGKGIDTPKEILPAFRPRIPVLHVGNRVTLDTEPKLATRSGRHGRENNL
jgi:hypothetical protein